MAKSAGLATSRFCSTADNGNRSAILHHDQMTNDPADVTAKPTGRDSVKQALIDATIELIIEQGTAISVRESPHAPTSTTASSTPISAAKTNYSPPP